MGPSYPPPLSLPIPLDFLYRTRFTHKPAELFDTNPQKINTVFSKVDFQLSGQRLVRLNSSSRFLFETRREEETLFKIRVPHQKKLSPRSQYTRSRFTKTRLIATGKGEELFFNTFAPTFLSWTLARAAFVERKCSIRGISAKTSSFESLDSLWLPR